MKKNVKFLIFAAILSISLYSGANVAQEAHAYCDGSNNYVCRIQQGDLIVRSAGNPHLIIK
jgi:hypothetical protein